MGAVAVALGLIWLAPGISDVHPEDTAGDGSIVEYPGEPDDHKATGKPAPLHFTLKDMNGADVQLASFKGKVILLNFWATWCGPCKAEIPSLVELQTQYGDDLVVLGFSVDDPVEKMRPYAAQYKINYPLLVGNGREDVQEAFGPLFGIPVSVIIGRDGKIAKKHSGIATKAQFEREIKALL
jgi:cytochrome c biogenesis protein CcmG/thiol:disulfide interchange protein DsbE